VQAQYNPKVEAVYGDGANSFSLATGSPGELGLLQALGEEFGKRENAKMVWIKAGSGASLNQLKNKQVDMIMVHAPAAVANAIADGWATKRTLIGSNEFYIVGPKSDPANIKSATSGADAYARIAKAKANFVIERVFERGDVPDIRNCRRYYGDEKVTEVLLNARFLPETRMYLASAVINRPLKDFRCYTLRQSNPELFPY
jgi:hypothetical protein